MEQSLDDVLNGVGGEAEAGTIESEVLNQETIEEAATEDTKGEPEKEESSEAKAEEADTKPVSENDDKEPWTKQAYLDEKRKRQEREKRIAELEAQQQEKPKAPDIFEDQEQYTGYVEDRISQAVGNTKAEMSEFYAKREYGSEVVDQKFEKFQQMVEENPSLRTEVAKTVSPWHTMVEKVNAAEKMEKLQDVDKYEAEVRAEIEAKVRAELEGEVKAKSDKVGSLTPSLAGQRSSGGDKAPIDQSLDEILGR